MKTFKQTCDKPYDRHEYRVGDYTLSSWEEAIEAWRLTGKPIEVLDKPKQRKARGF